MATTLKKAIRSKNYWDMNQKDLQEATRQFDRQLVADSSTPLSRAMRARWKKARRKLGRPIRGQGAKMIAITLERGLLKKVDSFARKKGLSRSAAIADGIEALLAAER